MIPFRPSPGVRAKELCVTAGETVEKHARLGQRAVVMVTESACPRRGAVGSEHKLTCHAYREGKQSGHSSKVAISECALESLASLCCENENMFQLRRLFIKTISKQSASIVSCSFERPWGSWSSKLQRQR